MRKIFTFSLFLIFLAWSLSVAFFGMLLIVSRSSILESESGRLLVKAFFFFLLVPVVLNAINNGFLRFFGIIKFEGKIRKTLNNNIVNGEIFQNIGDNELKEFFRAVSKISEDITFENAVSAGMVVVWTVLTGLLLKLKISDIIVVFFAGIFAVLLVYLFTSFFIEYTLIPVIRKIRKMAHERGLAFEEIKSFSLKQRFNYFIVFFFLIALMLLMFIPNITINILFLLVIGFIMILSISRVLVASIYKIFEEVSFFSSRLPEKQKTFFASGSFAKEALDLSDNLNKSAGELYEAREKERRLAEELQKKVAELEKWYKLTVGRELRMVELKQKIKELEGEVKGKEQEKKA